MRVVEKMARTVEEAVAAALAALGASRDEVEIQVLEEGNKGLFGLLGGRQARVRVWLKQEQPAETVGASPDAVRGGATAATLPRETSTSTDGLTEERFGATADEGEGEAAEEIAEAGWDSAEDAEEARNGTTGPPSEERLARARTFLTGILERMDVDAALESRIDEDGTVHINIVGEDLGLVIGRRGQTLDALQFLVNQVANRGEGRRVRIVLDAEGYRTRRAEALRALARRMAVRARRQGRKVALEPMNSLERRIVHLALAEEEDVETYSEGEEPHRRVIIVPRKA